MADASGRVEPDDPETCETCHRTDGIKFCDSCEDFYCDACYMKRRFHTTTKKPSGIPHGKSDPDIVKRVAEWVVEPRDEQDEKEQHQNDEDTIWLGWDKDPSGEPILAEYRRYVSIMMETAGHAPATRYPGLVSFVGPAGAGKSTLIRLLMDSGDHGASRGPSAPIIGRSSSSVPTSSGVHLYIDHKTQDSQHPILFADCEGFEGGERNPVAKEAVSIQQEHQPIAATCNKTLSRFTRALRWAARRQADHEKTGKRQYAVTEMYPRILHAFSDVIVFVLNNQRTMENVAEKLLEWAHQHHSSSINLPSKPFAVIALNKALNTTPEEQFDRATSTEDFLKSMDQQLVTNPTFQKYALYWPHDAITTMEDLFRRYYTGIHVIKIPLKARYQRTHVQRNILYKTIMEDCEKSFRKKEQCHMLADVDQFGLYLSLAFDHFSKTLQEPFDYVQASLKYRPPPSTLSDNILTFVEMIGQKQGLNGQIQKLFTDITDFTASCILLDASRKRLFAHLAPKRETDSAALLEYYKTRTPCKLCDKVKVKHEEEHRQKTKWGCKIFPGEFNHDLDPDKYLWENTVRLRVISMAANREWCSADEQRRARVLAHAQALKNFYGPIVTDPLTFISHSIYIETDGSSTGGIIALAFGHMRWSVKECIQKFEELVKDAFTLRKGQRYAGICKVEMVVQNSKYETTPLEKALKEAFGNEPLFGSSKTDPRALNVAVTSTSEAGTLPYLFSNYNIGSIGAREATPATSLVEFNYKRDRPCDPNDELQVWQAARATSAAPGFFKPLRKDKGRDSFMDGGVFHNNPIKVATEEARRLAISHHLSATPDILLSLGTCLPQDTSAQNYDHQLERLRAREKVEFGIGRLKASVDTLRAIFRAAAFQISLNIDSERIWKQWNKQCADLAPRAFRVNPDLGQEPPRLDEKAKVPELRDRINGWVQKEDPAEQISQICCTLVASSFYFERHGCPEKGDGSSVQVRGSIRCRLSETDDVKKLGTFLGACNPPATFVVEKSSDSGDEDKPIPVQEMMSCGRYQGTELTLSLAGDNIATTISIALPGKCEQRLFPLSGFPRNLLKHDFGPRATWNGSVQMR
ncbi:hypothetical protein G7054_g11908 [Neopestalotiopsis clavispora]|nr:hypothetical protein G7054_g11908 [Neopestalotiopsis clavispora]